MSGGVHPSSWRTSHILLGQFQFSSDSLDGLQFALLSVLWGESMGS